MNVCYCAPYEDASGYGEASRNAIKAIYTAGINIKTERVVYTTKASYSGPNKELAVDLAKRDIPYKIKVIHTTPDAYKNHMEKNCYNIGHLFWETDTLPSGWALACNKMDEIWTGTEYNAEVIKSSGVGVPITVIPQSIDTKVPEGIEPYRIPNFDGLLFYNISGWVERKNLRGLFEAYWKEFRTERDVGFLVKAHIANYTQQETEKIITEARRWRDSMGFQQTPRTFICTEILDNVGKHRIHKTGDCLVAAHRGEGWGLPQAEALVHGKAMISTGYGGIHEWLNSKCYFKLKYDMRPIDKVYNKYYEPGMKWAEPNEAHLRERMRYVYDKWKGPKTKGLLAIKGGTGRQLVNTMFTHRKVGEMYKARLEEISKELKNA